MACYRRLLAVDSRDAEAFRLLEMMLTRAERWNDLLTVYREAADNTLDQAHKKSLLFRMSALQEEALDDAAAAIRTFREILDVDADDAKATAALDRLYTALSRWQDLAELLIRRIERADALAAEAPERVVGEGSWTALKLRLGALDGKKFLLTWTYHPRPLNTAVANSAVLIASKLGMDVTLLCPSEAYHLDPRYLASIRSGTAGAGMGGFPGMGGPMALPAGGGGQAVTIVR